MSQAQEVSNDLLDMLSDQGVSPAVGLTALITVLIGCVITVADSEADAWEGLKVVEQALRMQFSDMLARKFS